MSERPRSAAVDAILAALDTPVLDRYLDDTGRVFDWAGLLADGLSGGERRMVRLAYRLGRHSGHIDDWTADYPMDVLDVLNHVDPKCQAAVLEALRLQYPHAGGCRECGAPTASGADMCPSCGAGKQREADEGAGT